MDCGLGFLREALPTETKGRSRGVSGGVFLSLLGVTQ